MNMARLLHAGPEAVHDGAAYGFTTREGGVAAAPFDTLTLARAPGVEDARVAENWRRVCARFDLGPERVALVHQVHGAEVLRVTEGAGPLAVVGEADALVTTTPNLLLGVRVADCVPVLISAPGGVAAAHAGWRGVAAKVVGATVASLCEAAACAPSALRAVIGPHIGVDAYEVGEEVVAGIAATGVAASSFVRPGPRPRVDLGAAVQAQLRSLGVKRVARVPGCTTEPHLFSHRVDGPRTGRQAGVVVWRG